MGFHHFFIENPLPLPYIFIQIDYYSFKLPNACYHFVLYHIRYIYKLLSRFFSITKGIQNFTYLYFFSFLYLKETPQLLLFCNAEALSVTSYYNNFCVHFHTVDTNVENTCSTTLQITCINLTKIFLSNTFFLTISSIAHILHTANTSITPTSNR